MNEKNVKELWNKFQKMPLLKQGLIGVAVVSGTVAILSNYKNIKNGTKEIVKAITNDEGVKEFMNDLDTVTKNISKVSKKYITGETSEETPEQKVTEEKKENE